MRKKSIVALIILSVSFLSSCNSNDDSPEKTIEQPNLVGKWSLDKWGLNDTNQTLTTCDKQGYIQFNANGTFERKDYFLNGSNCELEGDDNGVYTYNPKTSKITLKFTDPTEGSQTEILNNVSLTTTTIAYSWDEDENGTDEHKLEFGKMK